MFLHEHTFYKLSLTVFFKSSLSLDIFLFVPTRITDQEVSFWYFFDQDQPCFYFRFDKRNHQSIACYYLFHFKNFGVDSCSALENLRYVIIYSLNVQLTHISFLVNIYCVLWIHVQSIE